MAAETGRGREAERPRDIPRPGWKEVLGRVKAEIGDDNLNIVAAGIAFYFFLSVFPALFAAVSLYGLLADPAQLEARMSSLAGVVPAEVLGLVREQLHGIVGTAPSTLGWGAALSVLLAVWSAAKGAKALIGGLNIAYGERERRGFVKLQVVAFLFSLGVIVFLIVSIGLIAVVPGVVEALPLGPAGRLAGHVAQGALLLGLVLLALAGAYHYAPAREAPKWRWVTPGAFAGGLLWVAASGLFSWYAANFGKFNETYGTIAGVVALLLWLQISFLVILVGAELNAELEHQTAADTTEGPAEPMGARGAVMADTVPDSPAR